MTGSINPSFDFDSVDRFIPGAVGQPGRREFFLQAVSGTTVVSLKVEKQQVALLADYLNRVLTIQSLPDGPPVDHHDLVEPVNAEWVVGSIMVAVNEAAGRVVVVVEELVIPDDDDNPEAPEAPDGPDEGAARAEARFSLTRPQVEVFVDLARAAVVAGRLPCPLCGRPIDPGGHDCPRLN